MGIIMILYVFLHVQISVLRFLKGRGIHQKWNQLSREFGKEQVWGWRLRFCQVEFGDVLRQPFSPAQHPVLFSTLLRLSIT